MPAAYVELRSHSAFSFGDGAVTPEALATRAAELGYTALGLTDTADLGGIIRFAREAEPRGIRPIVGAELVVDGHPAAFLVQNKVGYEHLAALVTLARAGDVHKWKREDAGRAAGASPRGQPHVTWRQVADRSAGLYALTGPASGEIATSLRAGRIEEAREALTRWRDVFGERLAVEVQDHHAGRTEAALAGALIEVAETVEVPWVVTNDPRYLGRDSRRVHDMLMALRAGLTIEEAAHRGVLLPNGHWRLKSPDAMAARWARRPAGIEWSACIAEVCAFDLSWIRPPLPTFPRPKEYASDDAYLTALVREGAYRRWGTIGPAHDKQIQHELGVIERLGFAGFFLVMWDIVNTAHTNRILCQGRGSAANSVVAYCLGVTAVDPVKHGLLFERFLSEARVDGKTEAPDIDLDIEHERREEILDYAYGRWHRHQAAITCIVQTYHAPNAVLDAMRAFGYPADLAERLAKRVHRAGARRGAAILREGLAAEHGLDVTNPKGQALLQTIEALQDLPRLRSTHPGGFVLSSAELGNHLPIEPTTMGRTIVQFDKEDLDAVGIPKFDFLGLGALSHVRRSFDLIEQHTGERPALYDLPQDDPNVYALIARGDTLGMFQIESRAQIASLVHTRPDRLYDIVVQVALVRPGPIQARFVHPYTNRRRGREPVIYPHPNLKPILKRTQGIPIFQEQAMAIAMKLGGYTGVEADELRRTMGTERKKARLMDALTKLRARLLARNISENVAQQITTDLQSFANYGFPESHAWSFALIAYATAWLKTYHPAAFYAGLLNAWPMGFYSPATLVHDARRHGVEVRPPCLATGKWDCTLDPTRDADAPALRIGWRHINGLGERGRQALQRAYASRPFASIEDVVRRTGLVPRDAAVVARARAFAAWEPDRRRAAWEALRIAGDTRPLAPAWATHDFTLRPLSHDEEVRLDYEAIGMSTIGHPMERWRSWCTQRHITNSHALTAIPDGAQVVIAGFVVVRQQPATANGTVFLLLEDEFGVVNVIVNPRLVEQHRELVRHCPFLVVYGRIDRDEEEINVVGQSFEAMQGEALIPHSHDFH